MNLYAVILAGGASSRFWPLSGDEHPKYLLKPDGKRTLLEHAFERAKACTSPDRILVVTNPAQVRRVAETLPDLLAENLCIEPARRDTAAAIALSCRVLASRDPNAQVLVLPADQIIEPVSALAEAVRKAREQKDFGEYLHVFGIKPRRAEAGYGYIKADQCFSPGLCRVVGFREKPDAATAQRYASDGLHYWNAGCLLFAISAFERELASHMPSHSRRLHPAEGEVDQAAYKDLEAVSIDYGVLEKTKALRMIQLEAEFDDIGTWDALLARLEKLGVPPRAAFSVAGGSGNLVIGGGELVGVAGLSDVLVVIEGKKVLVLKRGSGQAVKEIARVVGETTA
ncbi:MAG: mannose-1-phosphate guanylyltransferase [Planctomycetes bacterium]|nr:mannose-1-phosphate guanylyltransferase [Planctomycetota bacterium]